MTDTGIQDRAGAAAGTAKEQARAVASDATDQARQLVDTSRQRLREQAGEQATRAASSLRDLGDQLQQVASGRAPTEGPVVDLARQAADGVQRVADALDRKRPEELLDDVKRFARQRPGTFVLGALGAGFLAGRLLRTVDTSALAAAAREGAGQGAPEQVSEQVSGPGSLAGLQNAVGGELGAGDAMAAGMAGTTPADLVEPTSTAIPTHPPRTEPLRATDADTGSEL